MFSEVWQTDEGEYVCHATNPAGRRSSPPAIVDVLGELEEVGGSGKGKVDCSSRRLRITVLVFILQCGGKLCGIFF